MYAGVILMSAAELVVIIVLRLLACVDGWHLAQLQSRFAPLFERVTRLDLPGHDHHAAAVLVDVLRLEIGGDQRVSGPARFSQAFDRLR